LYAGVIAWWVLIRDQADRDAISSRLMRYHDQPGDDRADIIDFLTMWPEARRQVARCSGRSPGNSPGFCRLTGCSGVGSPDYYELGPTALKGEIVEKIS
jgi:hypothetical protein